LIEGLERFRWEIDAQNTLQVLLAVALARTTNQEFRSSLERVESNV
jgi:hypothetical protein